MKLREAAQQALEALRCVRDMVAHPDNLEFIDRNVAALEAALETALAQQAEPDWQDLYLKEKQRADMWRDKYESVAGAEQRIYLQAEPVEPVAWRWGYRSVTTGEMDWRGYVEIAAHPNLRSPEIIMEPLYTAPQPASNALREAATQSLKWLEDEQEFADPECGDFRCSDCEVTRARQSIIDALRAALEGK